MSVIPVVVRVIDPINAPAYLAGIPVELSSNATHLLWRYLGAATWTNLIALADIPSGAFAGTTDDVTEGFTNLYFTPTRAVAALSGPLAAKADLASPAFSGIPTVPDAAPGTTTFQIANTRFVHDAIDALIAASPGTLDTLMELAAALGNDPNFATTMVTALASKAALVHTHLMADVTGLSAALLGKADSVHSHVISDVTGLSAALTGKADTVHSHVIADVTGLVAALLTKADLASPALTGVPTVPDAAPGTTTFQVANTRFVHDAIDALIASAPGTLNTLMELATALGNDPNFAATMVTALAGKAALVHTHAQSDITGLAASLAAKSDVGHDHDSRYYTETEVDAVSFFANRMFASSANFIKNFFEFFTDYTGQSAFGGGSDGEGITVSGTSAAVTITGTDQNRPGVANLNTGTTATGRASLMGSNVAMRLGGGAVNFERAVRIPTASTGTDRFQVVFGLIDVINAINQADAIAFLYDEGAVAGGAASANWQVMTSSNSTRTFTTTSVPVVAGQWYTCRAEVNAAGTSVAFYIDTVLVATITTNIPTASGRQLGYGINIFKSIGTGGRSVDTDYLLVQAAFTTPR